MSSLAAAHVVVDEPSTLHDDPAGVAYDAATGQLYIADGTSGAIARIGGNSSSHLATIDTSGPAGPDRLGAIALAGDALYATRVGHGRSSAIVRIDGDGASHALAKLPPRLGRHGLAYDAAEHALYATQFAWGTRGPFDGAIIVIDLARGEPSMILDGFQHPQGLAKLGSTLVVADARQRAVFRVSLVAGRAVMRLQLAGDIDRPHSVCALGDDAVLVTTYDDATQTGAVRRLGLDGSHDVIARGTWEPRGIATDGRRAFVGVRRGTHPGPLLVFDV